MRPPPAQTLLTAWERGRSRHPIDRAVLLYALAEPEAEPDVLPDAPLGTRNAALLRLRLATFGQRMRAYVDCAGCGSRLEIELDGRTLLASHRDARTPVVVRGISFRAPTSRDLASILDQTSAETAALRLLRLCAEEGGEPRPDAELTSILDAVETALEQADPLADVGLELRCHACGHAWLASLDIASFLWEEIDAYASRVLDEVHVLATAYGWSENAILSLSDSRRAAYIERATT
jgi:hypothetical protein